MLGPVSLGGAISTFGPASAICVVSVDISGKSISISATASATAVSICEPMSASIDSTLGIFASIGPVSKLPKSMLRSISAIVSTWTTPVSMLVDSISTVATFVVSSTSTLNSISIPPPVSSFTISISNESTTSKSISGTLVSVVGSPMNMLVTDSSDVL